jgi:hypothetical protein
MKPFDYIAYRKNNPLLKEDVKHIEEPLKLVITGKSHDLKFLDGVNNEEFIEALKNIGAKYKVAKESFTTQYLVSLKGEKTLFSNEEGEWYATSNPA